MEHSHANEARTTGRATPHLETFDGTAAEQVTAMAWARYLGSAFGSSGAVRSLRFYRDAGWISQDVYHTMVDYVRGLSVDELTDDADLDREPSIDSLTGTPYEDHARSLEFVAAIAGDSIQRDLTTLRLGEEAIGGALGNDGADPVPEDNQCAAVTQDGQRCSRPTIGGSDYCHQHAESVDGPE